MEEQTYKLKSISRGFSVIEIVVAAAVFALLAVGLSSAYLLFQKSYLLSGNQYRAIKVAEESLEAVRNIADSDFNNLVDGQHGLSYSGGIWSYSGTADVEGIFTRSVVVSSIDQNTKKAVANVSWQRQNLTMGNVTLVSYFTNWRQPFSAASCLVINTSTACFDATSNYKRLVNVSLYNSCNYNINIVGGNFSWNNLNKLEDVTINSSSVWNKNCAWGCTPTSSQSSNTQLNFGGQAFLLSTTTTVSVNQLLWDANMQSSTISNFSLNFDDLSVASTSVFSPFSCGVAPDTTPPGAVVNLSITSTTQNSAILSWTAPGDDNNTGTATSYDLRYSTSTITEANWAAASQAVGEPVPLVAGSTQGMTVSGLTASTTYYFAIKTSDEVPNISSLSNVAVGSTQPSPDVTPPSAINNLITTNKTNSSITLSWTAPGDDNNTGTATSYDLRYSTSTITEANWAAANQAVGEPVPLVAGNTQTTTVSGLSNGTVYYFAIKTSDEVPNISAISNIATTSTLDTIAPAAVTNLTATTSTTSTITLSWTAPGDDNNTGTATSYDLRYSTSTITEANWAAASQAVGEPVPLVAGSAQTFVVGGLNLNTAYYFAIKTSDEVPNISSISNVSSFTTKPTPQSSYLNLNITGAKLGNGNKDVTGIKIVNTSTTTIITIAQMIVSWTGGTSGSQLNSIRIAGGDVWVGANNSGLVEDITDTAIPINTSRNLDRLRFSLSMIGAVFDLTFIMIDGSSVTFSNIVP